MPDFVGEDWTSTSKPGRPSESKKRIIPRNGACRLTRRILFRLTVIKNKKKQLKEKPSTKGPHDGQPKASPRWGNGERSSRMAHRSEKNSDHLKRGEGAPGAGSGKRLETKLYRIDESQKTVGFPLKDKLKRGPS